MSDSVKEVKSAAKDAKKELMVPTIVELAKKKASSKQKPKGKKSSLPILVAVVVIILAIIAFAVLFLVPKYKYSFNISGVNYVSDVYTPSEFFGQFQKESEYVLITNFQNGKNDDYLNAASRLWLIALTADLEKRGLSNTGKIIQVVSSSDSAGNLLNCSTNDGNYLEERSLSSAECIAFENDSNYYKISVKLGNTNQALMSNKNLEIFAKDDSVVWQANYNVIQYFYPDFNQLLIRYNNIRDAIGTKIK